MIKHVIDIVSLPKGKNYILKSVFNILHIFEHDLGQNKR